MEGGRNDRQGPRGKREEGPCGVAVGPIVDDVQQQLKFLFEEIEGEVPVNDLKTAPDDSFFVFSVENIQISHKFTRISGNDYKGTKILVAAVNLADWMEITEMVNNALPQLVEEPVLKLSNLENHGITCNLNFSVNLTFIFFLTGLRCMTNSIDIKKIIFKGNKMKRAKGFFGLKDFFPDLQEMVFSEGMEIPEDQFEKMEVNVLFEADTEEEQAESLENSKWRLYPEHYYDGKGYLEPDYPFVSTGNPFLAGRFIHATIDMFNPVELDPEEFPTNGFIISFLNQYAEDINQIGSYYDQSALFSITVNQHGPQSNLEWFDSYSHNMFDNDGNVVYGPEQIVAGQKEVFQTNITFVPTLFHCLILNDSMASVEIHGAFEYNEMCFCFDRSIVVIEFNDQYYISNDHILIKEPPFFEGNA